MISFKQFLVEGGAATASQGTQRANQADMEAALRFIDKHTELKLSDMEANLLGSSKHTYNAIKRLDGKTDSGDVDIAIQKDKFNKQDLVDQLSDALRTAGYDGKYKESFGNVYSFAVPGQGNKLIQVDLMFVPSEEWAKWSYYSEANSNYKGAYRNMLLINTAKYVLVKGKDLEIKDDDGTVIIRVRRSLKIGDGFERLFKMLPMRKDGKGRVAALKKVKPADIKAELSRLGIDATFDENPDIITNPDLVAQMLFGPDVKAKDLLSTEQVIAHIQKLKNAKAIFRDSIEDFARFNLPVPPAIAQYAK